MPSSRRFTAQQLRAAIDRVRRDDVFRARIAPLQRACVATGGVRRAADIIEAEARTAVRHGFEVHARTA